MGNSDQDEGTKTRKCKKKNDVTIQGAPENLRDGDGGAKTWSLFAGISARRAAALKHGRNVALHLSVSGGRRQEAGRQTPQRVVDNDEADNFQSSLRVPWSLSSFCCIARTRVSEQNRVTVSGITRIQVFCLAQAHSTWHPLGRRPLPFVTTTSVLAPP